MLSRKNWPPNPHPVKSRNPNKTQAIHALRKSGANTLYISTPRPATVNAGNSGSVVMGECITMSATEHPALTFSLFGWNDKEKGRWELRGDQLHLWFESGKTPVYTLNWYKGFLHLGETKYFRDGAANCN